MSAGRADTDDDGFTLVDTLIAMAVLGIVLMMSVPPVLTAQAVVGRAADIDELRRVAQRVVEEVRALDFDDVGTPDGTPRGIVEPRRVIDSNGRRIVVDTDVSWQGAATGLAVVDGDGDGLADPGDGVAGFRTTGVDYKSVTVTATLQGRRERTLQVTSILGADELGSTSIGAVVVNVLKDEPPETPSPDTDVPVVHLIYPDGRWLTAAGLPTDRQVLLDFADPDQTFDLRLGPRRADLDDGRWALRTPYEVVAGREFVAEVTVLVHRVVTLEIHVQDSAGSPVAGSEVRVAADRMSEMTLGSRHEVADGHYVVSENDDGRPLAWGGYTIDVSAPGHQTTRRTIDVPAGYPDDTAHVETVVLDPVGGPGGTDPGDPGGSETGVTLRVVDPHGWEVGGTSILIDSPTLGTVELTANRDGVASLNLPTDEPVTVSLTSTRGFDITTHALTPAGATQVADLTLDVPAAGKVVHATSNHDADRYTFRARGWDADVDIDLAPSSAERVTFVVDDSDPRWHLFTWCDGDPDRRGRRNIRYERIGTLHATRVKATPSC